MVRVTVPELFAVHSWMQSIDTTFDANDTLIALDDFQGDFSIQAAGLLGRIKTNMLNAADAHAAAVRSVYYWCDFTIPVLRAYIEARAAGHDGDAAACHDALIRGQEQLATAKEKLTVASTNVNAATGKLRELLVQIKADFDPSTEYYKQLKARTEEKHRNMLKSGAMGGIAGGAGHLAAQSLVCFVAESSAVAAAAAESATATVILGPLGFVIAVVTVAGVCIYKAANKSDADFGPAIQKHLDIISNKLVDVESKVQTTQTVLNAAAEVIKDDKIRVHRIDATRRSSVLFVQIQESNLTRAQELSNQLIAHCLEFQARHPIAT